MKKATIDDEIKRVKTEVSNLVLEGILTNENIKFTKEKTKAVIEEVKQKWKSLKLEGDRIDVEKLRTMFQRQFPGLSQTTGRWLTELTDLVVFLLGADVSKPWLYENNK